MLKIDFHLHTEFSPDSRLRLGSLAKLCKEKGIVPAITDHNTMEGAEAFRKFKAPFIPGEEIRVSWKNWRADITGLFLTEPIPKSTDAAEALDLIKGQGGLSYLPHMFDLLRFGLRDEGLARRADIIEVFNGRSFGVFDRKAEALAKKLGKPGAAGSDSHFLYEFGKTWTEVECDGLEPKALLRAMKKGTKIVGERTSFFKRKWVRHFG